MNCVGCEKNRYCFSMRQINPNFDCPKILNAIEKIDKAIEYYEKNKQETVIGRNKDGKLIKDYYLPAHLSVNLIKILKK